MTSTNWSNSSVNSTGYTPVTSPSTNYTPVATGSTSWGNSGPYSDSALLLQDGSSYLLLQDEINNLGLQI